MFLNRLRVDEQTFNDLKNFNNKIVKISDSHDDNMTLVGAQLYYESECDRLSKLIDSKDLELDESRLNSNLDDRKARFEKAKFNMMQCTLRIKRVQALSKIINIQK